MALSQERIGQIAMLALVAKFGEEGLMLRPKEVKRQISNTAKKLGITPAEFAEFCKIVYEELYTKTMEEFEKITEQINSGKVKD